LRQSVRELRCQVRRCVRKGLVGGGVAAGFGGEVAAEAEHVGPAAQPAVGVVPLGLLLVAGPVVG
jgi:hypothetical protein